MKSSKKVISLVLAVILVAMTFVGCGNKEEDNGKIKIRIGNSPVVRTTDNAATYDKFQKNVAQFEAENPDIDIIADDFKYDVRNYLVQAAGGDLPTMFTTSPTELKQIVETGYIRSIDDIYKKYGFDKAYNSGYERLYTFDDKVYALIDPSGLYYMGIACNIELFSQAGLLDENGVPKFPKTWEEVAETAKVIKEKTGKAGLALATNSNQGGWHFLNIAWSYGVDFMKQTKDGKWKATFASKEGVEALQFIKDLRWKHDVLQAELNANIGVGGRLLSTNDAGMIITQYSVLNGYVKNYGLDPKNIAMCQMPGGPAGRYTQIGSDIYVFDANATDEEVEACFKWLAFIGKSTTYTEADKEKWEQDYALAKEEGKIVGVQTSGLWKDSSRTDAQKEIMDKYKTVDEKYFADYVAGKDVEFKFEPERCTQQLYSVLDVALQEVLLNKDADCKKVLEKAQKDFQANYLDKE